MSSDTTDLRPKGYIAQRFKGSVWRLRDNTAAWIALACVVVIAGWAATAALILTERHMRFELDQVRAQELVGVLDAHTNDILSYADTYLKIARQEFLKDPSLDGLQEYFRIAPPNPETLSHITVMDRTGKPLFITGGTKLKPDVSASDRDYFKYLKATPGDSIYISRPVLGRNTGILTIRIARRIEKSPGQFDGLIFAAITAEVLTEPFQSLMLGRNTAVGLIGLDGKSRAWAEGGRFQSDLDASDWDIWPTMTAEPDGLETGLEMDDGIIRDLAYRRLGEYPLIAVIGIARSDISDATSGFTWSAISMAALVTLFIAVLTTSILRDIRMMRALEDEIAVRRRAEAEAVHATEIKSSFLATMSHEIRTPINAILGLFELIEQADVPERQKRQARAGQAAASDLFKQLTNVLDASRLEANSLDLSLRNEQVAPMVAALTQLLEAAIKTSGKPIQSSSHIGPDVPHTMVIDRRRVEQIMLNFIDNAVKFTESGRIDLDISVKRTEGRPELSLCVRDTGAGMSKPDQARLFKRFSQLDSAITRNAGGAGLGLSICKDLAELMHARLTVDSQEGVGSRFALKLKIES